MDLDRPHIDGARRTDDSPSRRVVVLRALQLGDLLCAVPAFRALRGLLSHAHIALVGLPWARAFVARYPEYLDDFHEFPGFPGLPERTPDVSRIPAFLAEIQARRYDLAVQLHGSGPFVNPLTVLFGARRAAGFYLPGDYCPDPECFIPWPERGLEIHRLLRLVYFLGDGIVGDSPAGRGASGLLDDRLEFPLRKGDFASLRAALEGRTLRPGKYACVHPGASVPERRWPAERFAAVADALAGRGLRVVLTGTAAEAPLTAAVARAMRREALDLAGRTDLGAAGALIAGARLLVCNDTGVSHIAAGLRTPSVVVSTGDNPARWAPTDRERHRVLCRDSGVDVGEVIEQADALMDRFPAVGGRAELAAVGGGSA